MGAAGALSRRFLLGSRRPAPDARERQVLPRQQLHPQLAHLLAQERPGQLRVEVYDAAGATVRDVLHHVFARAVRPRQRDERPPEIVLPTTPQPDARPRQKVNANRMPRATNDDRAGGIAELGTAKSPANEKKAQHSVQDATACPKTATSGAL